MEKLLKKNIDSIDKESFVHLKRREDMALNGQNPRYIVIACSDSRVIPEEIFDASIGELFVIRTAGNTIGENELASVAYGINHLHIDKILVLGHTHCGAIHGALSHNKEQELAPIMSKLAKSIGEETDEKEASKANAKYWRDYLLKRYPDKEIKAGLYDLETNRVIYL